MTEFPGYRRFLRAWAILARTFGAWFLPLGLAFFVGMLRTVAAVGWILDALFVRRLARQKIERPIVIIGPPRSGTTFIHRFFSQHGVGQGTAVWRALYPSVSIQRLIRPIIPFLDKVSPTRAWATEAHETGLLSIETDDAALLSRFLDGYLFFALVMAWDEADPIPLFHPAHRDTLKRDFDWMERVWRVNMVSTGTNRQLAKHFSVGSRAPAFLERYPDAKLIWTFRDPLEAIPSALSLITGVLDRGFGFWTLPEDKRKLFFERGYKGMVLLYQLFYDDWVSGRIDRDKVMVVPYDRLMVDFEKVAEEILAFVDHEPTPEFQRAIDAKAEKQRSYQSGHKYDLERFGLSEEQIRRDLAAVYETFASA